MTTTTTSIDDRKVTIRETNGTWMVETELTFKQGNVLALGFGMTKKKALSYLQDRIVKEYLDRS